MSLEVLATAEGWLAEQGSPLYLGSLLPVVAGGFGGMGKGDWVVAGPRERVGAVLRGCPVERLLDPALGARPYKLAPTSGAPAARALHAVGLALASGGPVLCFLGAASAAGGAFYEALNSAVLTGAQVIFLLTVRASLDDAPVGPQTAISPGPLAATIGLSVHHSGADAQAVSAAVAQARAAGGPALVEVTLP